MRNMIERISLVCALASAPLMLAAQESGTDDGTMTADPAPTEQAAPAEMGAETAPTEQIETIPEPVEGQIVLQSEDSILANDLIGLTVYSATEESVGDINDIIVKLDGTVEGVVVGVGGFLGIGEKEVAIELDKIDLVSLEGGGTRLILSATREDLEAAPAFKTAREQQREAEAEAMQQQLDQGVAPVTTEAN